MASSDNKRVIRIESILGGHSVASHFAAPDQFRTSVGIDPAQPISDGGTNFDRVASGLLRPVPVTKVSGSVLDNAPLWMVSNPKNGLYYIYDAAGSVYSANVNTNTLTEIADLNDGGTAAGNGAAYYDNYVYFSRSTTIARYGPLDGTPSFTDDYWVGVLGKTALVDKAYPIDISLGLEYPNHILHRHSDGRLYILDVVDNRGTVHYIATTKTTVEGDTDNSSTYNKLQFGYGLWPTTVESYGSDLAIALFEGAPGVGANTSRTRAKIAFWDTTSANFNKIIWREFPDEIITGMRNVNGVLYVASGNSRREGFRLTRFIGGYTIEEVVYIETGQPPYPNAMDGDSSRLLFGSYTNSPITASAVYSYGLQKASLSQGIFNVSNSTGSSSATITSVVLLRNNNLEFNYPIIGWSAGSNDGEKNGIDRQETNYSNAPCVWWSQIYRIGQPFKITKIRIPLAQAVSTNIIVTPVIYTDDGMGTTYTGGSSNGLAVINNSNFSGKRHIVMRPENLTGEHNFWLELTWTGAELCVIGLPITIEYELIDD